MIGRQVLEGQSAFHTWAVTILLLCIALSCLARILIDGHERHRDLKFVLILFPVVTWEHRYWILDAAKSSPIPWPTLGSLWLGIAGAFVVYKFLAWCLAHRSSSIDVSDDLSPYLVPARTTHTRFFPEKHSFSYSYLLIAVPVGWEGAVGSFFSIDAKTTSRAEKPTKSHSWFSIDASDYLDRGTGHQGLKAKLDDYLRSHGLDPEQYTSSWLVTAPRFLGYSFNPVSYWYLYRGDQLDAMILEVNNTFDERRMYFLTKGSGGESVDFREASFENHKFRGAWPKDFHVSPFNSRKGSYALSALDPNFKDGPWIDNNITLRSSKEHAKLVARNFSTDPAIGVRSMSVQAKALFIASWFWIGFMTSPRILREAARLFFQRKLHVWYRPEISTKSIGRNESDRERVVEGAFREFLRHLATSKNTTIRYTAAGNALPHEEVMSPATEKKSNAKDVIALHILTPLFYTHIALSPSIAAYMRNNAAAPTEERTFTCSSLETFTSILSMPAEPAPAPLDFRILTRFRPHRLNNDKEALAHEVHHELDRFVLAEHASYQRPYRKAATALALSHVLFPYLPEFMDVFMTALRIGMLFWSERCVVDALQCMVNAQVGSTMSWIGCAYLAMTMMSCL